MALLMGFNDVLTVIIALITFWFLLKLKNRPKNLPPGPWGIPILGCIPWLVFSKKDVRDTFRDWSYKYGPIYSLKMGSASMVVLNDSDSINDALIHPEFQDRTKMDYTLAAPGEGYGHLAPRTFMSRCLVVPYAVIGVPLTALLLDTIGDRLEARIKSVQCRLYKMTSFIHSGDLRRRLSIAIICLVVFCLLIVAPSLIFTFVEDWGYFEAQYFTFQTISTIGFGDLVAGNSDRIIDHSWKRAGYRYSLIMYIIVGLSVMGILLRIVRRREEKEAERISMRTRQLLGNDLHTPSSSASKGTVEQEEDVTNAAFEEESSVAGDVLKLPRGTQEKQITPSESAAKGKLPNIVNREVQTDITFDQLLADLRDNVRTPLTYINGTQQLERRGTPRAQRQPLSAYEEISSRRVFPVLCSGDKDIETCV